jgi:hypothetical protein
MRIKDAPRRSDAWVDPPDPAEQLEAGHAAHVRSAIAEAPPRSKPQGIPAEDVWEGNSAGLNRQEGRGCLPWSLPIV